MNEQDIIELIKQSPKLEEMDLYGIPITDAVLVALKEKCPRLRIFAHYQAMYITDSDIYMLSGKIRKKIQRGEPLENSENLPGWKEAVELLGQEEKLFTPIGIEAIGQIQLDQLWIGFHPRVDRDQLISLRGRVKQICLPARRTENWDERMVWWYSEGTLVGTGNEK